MTFEAFMGSVPGPYHIKKNIPNQDAILFHEEQGVMFAAVADGAGSLKHSDVGAYDAVESAVHGMVKSRKNLDPAKLVEYGITIARENLLKRENYKQYGSTLTLVVLLEDGTGAVAALGDSFVVLHGEAGEHILVTGTPSGEYANTTELLSSDEYTPVIETFEGVKAISLSSDGLEGVAIQGGNAHGGFWDGVISQAYDDRLDISKIFRWLDSLDRLVDDTSLLTIIKR